MRSLKYFCSGNPKRKRSSAAPTPTPTGSKEIVAHGKHFLPPLSLSHKQELKIYYAY